MRTMITAHAGCEGTPDNSMENVRCALACAADTMEIDVHPRPDGGFYLSHDPSEGDCPGLEEAFALLKTSGKKVNCDLKVYGIEHAVLAAAERCGVADRVIFSGFVSREAMADPAVRDRAFWDLGCALPELEERYSPENLPRTEELRRALEVYRKFGAKVVNVYYPLCTEENLALFREAGVGVSAWTVNDEAELRRLLGKGLVNITTRRPVLACSLRDGTN